MGSFSVWHWLIVLVLVGIFIYPVARIISKAGYSSAWALLWLVPLVNIVALWVFAFADWPVRRSRSP
jgi:hypothetical protein